MTKRFLKHFLFYTLTTGALITSAQGIEPRLEKTKDIVFTSLSDVFDYSTTQSTRSPLEFYGRTFNSSGSSAANMLASDESITIDFSNYLGRIDRIFITKTGEFQVVYGTPSENPQKRRQTLVDMKTFCGAGLLMPIKVEFK